jgi:hypothetical protein
MSEEQNAQFGRGKTMALAFFQAMEDASGSIRLEKCKSGFCWLRHT